MTDRHSRRCFRGHPVRYPHMSANPYRYPRTTHHNSIATPFFHLSFVNASHASSPESILVIVHQLTSSRTGRWTVSRQASVNQHHQEDEQTCLPAETAILGETQHLPFHLLSYISESGNTLSQAQTPGSGGRCLSHTHSPSPHLLPRTLQLHPVTPRPLISRCLYLSFDHEIPEAGIWPKNVVRQTQGSRHTMQCGRQSGSRYSRQFPISV